MLIFFFGRFVILKFCKFEVDIREFNWEGWYIFVEFMLFDRGVFGFFIEEGDIWLFNEDGGIFVVGFLIGERDGFIWFWEGYWLFCWLGGKWLFW